MRTPRQKARLTGKIPKKPASPDGFNVVSSFKISHGTGEHWAHPAISNGLLYVRHGDALMAYDIEQKQILPSAILSPLCHPEPPLTPGYAFPLPS